MQNKINKLLDLLEQIADLEKGYKKQAYITAINTLPNYADKLCIWTKEEWMQINGIGDGISNKIIEFCKTGYIKKLDELKGIEQIETEKPKLKLSNKGKWSLGQAKLIIIPIFNKIKKIKGVVKAEITGSIRRNYYEVGDGDILVAVKNDNYKQNIISEFFKFGEKLISGNIKNTIIVNNFQIDINFCSPDEWGSQLMHHTGSKAFNINCRKIAWRKGGSLSQYGIKIKDKTIKFKIEEKVFKWLGIEYLNPWERGKGNKPNKEAEKTFKQELKDKNNILQGLNNYPIDNNKDYILK